MKERDAVERLIKRIYDDRLRRTGKTPEAGEARELERRVMAAAERTDNTRDRK